MPDTDLEAAREELFEAIANYAGGALPTVAAHVATVRASDNLEAAAIQPYREALQGLVDAVEWMSGSGDFGPEGVAAEGWANTARPALKQARAALHPEEVCVCGHAEEYHDRASKTCIECSTSNHEFIAALHPKEAPHD